MISVIQRVSRASVTIDDEVVGEIAAGIMALVCIEAHDTEKEAMRLLERILNYRIFPDDAGRMNLSLRDVHGGLLLVPQFTLAADTRKGCRPSFASSAAPELGRRLFAYLQALAGETYAPVQYGRFGCDMQVALINDGPVTFILKT